MHRSLLAAVAVALTGVPALAQWSTTTVDAVGNTGYYASLALDASLRPHVSYLDQSNEDLKYATFDGVSWSTQTIVGTIDFSGQRTSLGLGAGNLPGIAFSEIAAGSGEFRIRYSAFDGAIWNTQTIDTGGLTVSLAHDALGRPHIAYDAGGELRYAFFDGVSWNTQSIVAGGIEVGQHGLALNGLGLPRVAYYDNGDLKYASFDGVSWNVETVESTGNVGAYAALALDSAGNPHIAHYSFTDQEVRYTTNSGGGWGGVQTFSATFNALDLRIGPADRPYLAYAQSGSGDLTLQTLSGGIWTGELIGDGALNWGVSLAVGSDERARIAYNSGFTQKFAEQIGGGGASAPEPGTIALVGVGALGMALSRRGRRIRTDGR